MERNLKKSHFPPPLREVPPKSIVRKDLLKDLDQGLRTQKQLILLTAPVGYGKTVLLQQWVQRHELPTIWLDLKVLPSSSREASVQLEKELLLRLQDELNEGDSDLESLLKLAPPSLIVLDNYESLGASYDSLKLLKRILQVDSMKLILSTRRAPLPSQIFLKTQIDQRTLELNLHDLQFSLCETRQMFSHCHGIELLESELCSLYKKTRGWPLATRLAGSFAEKKLVKSNQHHSFESWPRHDHNLHSFLFVELFSKFEKAEQIELLKLAFFRKFSEELLLEVGLKLLSENHRRPQTFLIIPHGTEGKWYQLHPLFAHFLQKESLRTLPDGTGSTLHSQASEWFEKRGDFSSAIRHAVHGDDNSRIVRLLKTKLSLLEIAFNYKDSLNWFRALPSEMVEEQFELCSRYAAALLGACELRLSLTLFERADTLAKTQSCTKTVALCTAAQAFIHTWLGNKTTSKKLYKKALSLLTDAPDPLRLASALYLLATSLALGDVIGADVLLKQFPWLSRHNTVEKPLLHYFFVGQVREYQGRYGEALEFFERFIGAQESQLSNPYVQVALAYSAEMHLELGNLKQAEEIWNRVSFPASGQVEKYYLGAVYSRYAKFLSKVQRGDEALKLLQSLRKTAIYNSTLVLDASALHIYVERGEFQKAEELVRSHGVRQTEEYFFQGTSFYLAVLRFWVSRNQVADLQNARIWIDFLIKRAKADGRVKDHIYLLGQNALLAKKQGLKELQISEFNAAKDLNTEGIYPALFDELNDLLRESSKVELTLSSKEKDIIELLAEGLSDNSIGEKLFISPNTVKWHNRRIYQKLDVSGRDEAVNLCRELGLI